VLIGAEHEELRSASSAAAASGVSASDAAFATYAGRFGASVNVDAGLRYERDDRYGASTTGRFGAAWRAWRGGKLRAATGTAYKAPTIDETSGGGFTGPNAHLKPETSREWEVGAAQGLWGGRVRLEVDYFDRDTQDLIEFGFPSYVNAPGRTRARGVELSASASLARFDVSANYTHENQTLLRIPRDEAAVDVSWRASARGALGAALVWTGEKSDINTGPFPATPVTLAAWTRVDLRAAWRLSGQVEIYGRVENAGDARYEELFGYGVPGRTFYAGVRVRM
jgi:vitamin B12 transporter